MATGFGGLREETFTFCQGSFLLLLSNPGDAFLGQDLSFLLKTEIADMLDNDQSATEINLFNSLKTPKVWILLLSLFDR